MNPCLPADGRQEGFRVWFILLWCVTAIALGAALGGIAVLALSILGIQRDGVTVVGPCVVGSVVSMCAVLALISGLTERRLLPLPIGLVRVMTCGVFRLARTGARLIGWSDDALGCAFLTVQNGLTLAWLQERRPRTLLVLLPHCLEARVQERIEKLLNRYRCQWHVVKGGTEALHVVTSTEPDGLLAVACQRDLLNGMMSLGGRVPCVLVLPNIRGEQPCRATGLDLCRLADAMDRLAYPREDFIEGGKG
ncbi:DUF116 domain-containing protein [Candidatus Fermentibacteria bacterium]|nr:DUF116 domain-containing protein [Candidatus Fermentibacteria bacterium]